MTTELILIGIALFLLGGIAAKPIFSILIELLSPVVSWMRCPTIRLSLSIWWAWPNKHSKRMISIMKKDNTLSDKLNKKWEYLGFGFWRKKKQ